MLVSYCCVDHIVQLKPITTVCRAAAGPCDLTEYCSGINNTCPSDAYLQNGTSCTVRGVSILWLRPIVSWRLSVVRCYNTLCASFKRFGTGVWALAMLKLVPCHNISHLSSACGTVWNITNLRWTSAQSASKFEYEASRWVLLAL